MSAENEGATIMTAEGRSLSRGALIIFSPSGL